MVEDCPFGYGMCRQIDELLTLYAFDLRNKRGYMNPCWVNGIEASLLSPLTSTSLLTISSLMEKRIIEMDEQRCTYTSTPPSECTRWNTITYNPNNDELQGEWLKQSSICMHMNGNASIFTLMCMQMDGIHEWVFSGYAYVYICMHEREDRCRCMHMHAESA